MNINNAIQLIRSKFIGGTFETTDPQLITKHDFKPLYDKIPGWSNPNVCTLLNTAVSQLPDSECYFEVGVFTGVTFFSSLQGNEHKRLYGCDPLPILPDYDLHDLFWKHRDKYDPYKVTEFHELSCWDLKNFILEPFDRPIGVYFYDGPHEYEAQYRAFYEFEEFLADEALIVVDDMNYRETQEACSRWLQERKEITQLFYLKSSDMHPVESWWNGIGVFKFER